MDQEQPGEREVKLLPGEVRAVVDVMSWTDDSPIIVKWRAAVEKLLAEVRDEAKLKACLEAVAEREQVAVRGELNAVQYVYKYCSVVKRLTTTATSASQEQKVEFKDPANSARMEILPPEFKPPPALKIKLPVLGSKLNRNFLGQYDNLFNMELEKPLPTWEAFEWLLEDYGGGVQQDEEVCYDRLYKEQLEETYQEEVPEAVKMNGHFCDCPRRYKWDPNALIDSKEYNWPVIEGNFTTPVECAVAYERFFEQHKEHTDPVCFRAAIFCQFLAYFCRHHKVICNVNEFSPLRPEFHIWLKVEYRCSRWHRMIEVMSILHFFYGPHTAFINEFPQRFRQCKLGHRTKYKALQNFLNLQKQKNPAAVLEDDELRTACTKEDKKNYSVRTRQHERMRNLAKPQHRLGREPAENRKN